MLGKFKLSQITEVIENPYIIWAYPIIASLISIILTSYILLYGVYDVRQNSLVLERINSLSLSVDVLKEDLSSINTKKLNKDSLMASYVTLDGIQEVSDMISDVASSFDSGRFKVVSKTSAPTVDPEFPDLKRMIVKFNIRNLILDDKSLESFNSSLNRLERHPKKNNLTRVRILGESNNVKSFEVTFMFWLSASK